MGYYTVFKGSVLNTNDKSYSKLLTDAQKDITVTGYGIPVGEFVDSEYLNDGESMKWYDYERDMKQVSLLYPGLIFCVEGEGEESGDMWKAYFRDGNSVIARAKFTFPEVDFDKDIPENPAAVEQRSREIAIKEAAERAKAEQDARMRLDQAEVALKEAQENLERLTS